MASVRALSEISLNEPSPQEVQEEHDDDVEEPKPEVGKVMSMIASIALVNMFAYALNLVNGVTNIFFVGRMGTAAQLAGVGVGNVMQNCFCLSIGFGFTASLDLLVSQAHRQGKTQQAWRALQRCRLLMTLMLVWMVPLLNFSQPILQWINLDEVAEHAGAYNRASVGGLFFLFQFEVNRKFMQHSPWPTAPVVICFFVSVLHVFWCGVFVLYFDMGNVGAGAANSVTWFTQFFLSSAVLACNCKAMGFRKRDVLWISKYACGCRDGMQFLRVALPATVQICSEWWFWEICTVIVAYLGVTPLAAHVATISVITVMFTPTVGINASTATLVGLSLCQNNPRQAKLVVWTCVVLNLIFWVGLGTTMYMGRFLIAAFYTDVKEVQEVMHQLLTIFAVAGFLDTTQNIMGGAIRGSGRPQKAALAYLVSFYLVMLPIGIVFAFPLGLSVIGMYLSFLPGCGVAVLFFGGTLCCTDWVKLAREAFYEFDSETPTSSASSSVCASPAPGTGSAFGASLQPM